MPVERKCQKCDAVIRFEKNEKTGKFVPISVATGQSHFLDCPKANDFSGRNR